ncbi:MAG: hypothetical protein ACNA8L_06925, partial [Luteolibacter sp.]
KVSLGIRVLRMQHKKSLVFKCRINKREAFVSRLSLDEQSGFRSSSIIGHGLFHRETWDHESGLTITATESLPARNNYVFGLDDIFTPVVQDNRVQESIRESFDFFVVAKGNRVIYKSWDGEQAASSNH